MNFFFRECNGKLKEATKQKSLLRLSNWRKPDATLGFPLLLDLRKLLSGDLIPSSNVLEITL